MSISLLDALQTFQGTNSSFFSQPLLEATSREELENISSLVFSLEVGKLGVRSSTTGNDHGGSSDYQRSEAPLLRDM